MAANNLAQICVAETRRLAAAALEVAHERHKRVDAGLREGVVDRGAHAADGTVTLEAVEARRRRLLQEYLLQFLGWQPEGDVHQRPAVRVRRASIEASPINL